MKGQWLRNSGSQIRGDRFHDPVHLILALHDTQVDGLSEIHGHHAEKGLRVNDIFAVNQIKMAVEILDRFYKRGGIINSFKFHGKSFHLCVLLFLKMSFFSLGEIQFTICDNAIFVNPFFNIQI